MLLGLVFQCRLHNLTGGQTLLDVEVGELASLASYLLELLVLKHWSVIVAQRSHNKVILLSVTMPTIVLVEALALRRCLVQIAKKLAVLVLADLGVRRARLLVHRTVLRVAPGLELGVRGCKRKDLRKSIRDRRY